MNDSELRRRELLKQTRRLYQDSAAIPAVHPRYGHIYHELYDTPDSGEGEHHSGSFFARLMLAVFLFLSFVYIEQNHLKPDEIPGLLDPELPPQAIVSALRKYST